MQVTTPSPKQYLYKNMDELSRHPLYHKMLNAIIDNGHIAIGLWGAKGAGKSELAKRISEALYGSLEEAHQHKIQTWRQIPSLVTRVQENPRYWIRYKGVELKRIWVLDWDDMAADLPSSKGQTKEFIAFQEYYQTIRSDVAVLLGSFVTWGDLKARARVGFNGEILVDKLTTKGQDGKYHERREAWLLWWQNRPHFKRKYEEYQVKSIGVKVNWKALPEEEFKRENAERMYLTQLKRQLLARSDLGRVDYLIGLKGADSDHLLEMQKEMLKAVRHAIGPRITAYTDTFRISRAHKELFGIRVGHDQARRELRLLHGAGCIIYRPAGLETQYGTVELTLLGQEVLKRLSESAALPTTPTLVSQ